MQTNILWFLIYFMTTEGFGLRSESWGGLGKAGLGWFGALQILVAIISVAAIVPGMKYLFRNRKTPIGSAVLMISLLPVYMILVTIARGAFVADVGFGELFRNLLQLKFFLLLYLFAYLISRRNGFEIALQAMAIYALVTAVSILLIITFDLQTAVAVAKTSPTDVTRLFRMTFPGALLVAMGWLLYFSKFLTRGGISTGIASLVCLAATISQLHRSTLASIAVTILVLAYWVFTSAKVTTSKRRWVLGGVFGILVIGAILTFSSSAGLALDYVKASLEEVTNVSGNSGLRANIVRNSWIYIFSDAFGLGLGLDWDRSDDLATLVETAFTAGPTFDSSYANVIIVFGLPGVGLYVWLLMQLAGLTRSRNMARDEPLERAFALFLRAFLVYCVIVGLGYDFVVVSSGTATFSFVIVAAVRLQELRSNRAYSA
jgi:hypothetical protein